VPLFICIHSQRVSPLLALSVLLVSPSSLKAGGSTQALLALLQHTPPAQLVDRLDKNTMPMGTESQRLLSVSREESTTPTDHHGSFQNHSARTTNTVNPPEDKDLAVSS
ncbi:unnamed protein product, partial [Ascophyllum nodosum]